MTEPTLMQLPMGETVQARLLVRSAELAAFRNKPGRYLNLRLADRSGEMLARLWEGAEQWEGQLSPGTVVEVRGQLQEYQGAPQLVLQALRVCEPGEYDLADLLPASARPREEMLEELTEFISSVQDPHLHELLELIFGEEEFLGRFVTAPGASRLHHAFVGGLLEHTLAVARLCEQAAATHPQLNRDLLMAGALLHDLGKVFEVDPAAGFTYTEEGHFCGHVVLTDRYVTAKIGSLSGFPVQSALLLTHILLSHHGELQWGAPVRPKLAEAYALHYADNLDAKVQIVEDWRASPEAGGGSWSRRHHALETPLYLGPTQGGWQQEEE